MYRMYTGRPEFRFVFPCIYGVIANYFFKKRLQHTKNETISAIWNHFCNLTNMKNIHGGVILLVTIT